MGQIDRAMPLSNNTLNKKLDEISEDIEILLAEKLNYIFF